MMDQDQNLGVTEARFALTIVICLLVAVGYVALMRLGGGSEPVVDEGPDSGAQVQIAPIDPTPPDNANDPEVLPVIPMISTRPDAVRPPALEIQRNGSDATGVPDASFDSQRR